MRSARTVLLVVALVVTMALGVAYLSAGSGSKTGTPVQVLIEPGSSAGQIANELEKREVVTSALAFRVFLKLKGSAAELKAGEYRLRTKMPFGDLLGELRKGPEVGFVKLTIPEGLTVDQTAEVVGKKTKISAAAFAAAATAATAKPAVLPDGVVSLEGFLYPNTYYVIEKESAEELVRRIVAQFGEQTAKIPWNLAAKLGITPYKTLTVASMIEEEAKVDSERPLISAVIHNRLRRGMKLEIDATVQYAVRKYGKPLTQDDLDVDSPYNTRRYAGLPPGPISSPRLDSILAALRPAQTNAIYYVLTEDCKHHFFTADYDAFLKAKSRQRSDC